MQTDITGKSFVSIAIERLKEHEPAEGYHLAFSGGKDSICCYKLCMMSGVKFVPRYSMTTIDPAEVTRFIRKEYPNVIWDRPFYKGHRTNFYELVSKMGLPNRHRRWCCGKLKESNGPKGSTVVLGVRWAESAKRKGRPVYGKYNGKFFLNPIVDWSDEDVWEFIRENELAYPSVYDTGSKRVGCILCPLACRKKRLSDYEKYPQHVLAIEKAVSKYLETHSDSGLFNWGADAHEIVYHWVADSPIESAKGSCMQSVLSDANLDDTEV